MYVVNFMLARLNFNNAKKTVSNFCEFKPS